jgi:hypothetical protein
MPVVPEKVKGLWVPRILLEADDLTPSDRLLLARIDALDQDERGCFASNRMLGEFLGLSPGTIRNMLHKLKEDKWVSASMFGPNRRSLRVTFEQEGAHVKVRPPARKSAPPRTDKCAQGARKSAQEIKRRDLDREVDIASSETDDAPAAIKKIYCGLTGRPWLKSDQKTAEELANIDLRIVEIGIRAASLKKSWADNGQIFSLKYFKSEIDSWGAQGLTSDAIDARLFSLRQKLDEERRSAMV